MCILQIKAYIAEYLVPKQPFCLLFWATVMDTRQTLNKVRKMYPILRPKNRKYNRNTYKKNFSPEVEWDGYFLKTTFAILVFLFLDRNRFASAVLPPEIARALKSQESVLMALFPRSHNH